MTRLHALAENDKGLVAAADREETAAGLGSLGIGELFDAVDLAYGDAVRAIRETTAIFWDVPSQFISLSYIRRY